jgi:hypothetical protein
MNRRSEIKRNQTILLLCAPAAVAVWYVFHGVYADLSQTERAAGYVDPATQMGIELGYAAMIAGTLIFAGLAALAAFRLLVLWLGERH